MDSNNTSTTLTWAINVHCNVAHVILALTWFVYATR